MRAATLPADKETGEVVIWQRDPIQERQSLSCRRMLCVVDIAQVFR